MTFDPDKFAQPKFTGLLGQAPYVAGQASSLMRRLESYRSGLADIVGGITTLYAASDRLPVVPGADDVVTVLHVSDIHLNPLGFDLTERLVKEFDVDMVLDTGDITTWGTEVESSVLWRIKDVGVPYVFVRGNHDSLRTQQAVAQNPNAIVLDGTSRWSRAWFSPASATRSSPPTPTPRSTRCPARRCRRSLRRHRAPRRGRPGAGPERDADASASPSASPRPDWAASSDPEVRAGGRLADVVQAWNAATPGSPWRSPPCTSRTPCRRCSDRCRSCSPGTSTPAPSSSTRPVRGS